MTSIQLRAKVLLSYLPQPKNKVEVIIENQTTNDIILEMLEASKRYQYLYDLIPIDFFKDFNDLWNFTKKLFIYKEDSDKNQNLFSPVVMIEEAINKTGTIDCKNYSLIIGGVCQMWVNSGRQIDWYFKYVGYDNDEPSHVYVVANGIVLDCCENKINKESIYFNYICVNPFTKDMAINRISGKRIGDLDDPGDTPPYNPTEDPNSEFYGFEYDDRGWFIDPETGQEYAEDGSKIDVNEERGYYTEEGTGKQYTLEGTEIITNPDSGWYREVESGKTYADDGSEIILNPENGTYLDLSDHKTYADDGAEVILDPQNGFYKEVESGIWYTDDGTEVVIDERNGFYKEVGSNQTYTFDGTEVTVNYDRGFYTEKDGSQYSFDGTPVIVYANGTYKDLEDGKIYNDNGTIAKSQTSTSALEKIAAGVFGGSGSTSIPSKSNGDPTKTNPKTTGNGTNKPVSTKKTGKTSTSTDDTTNLLTPTNIAIGAGIILLLFLLTKKNK